MQMRLTDTNVMLITAIRHNCVYTEMIVRLLKSVKELKHVKEAQGHHSGQIDLKTIAVDSREVIAKPSTVIPEDGLERKDTRNEENVSNSK
jgi:3-deoxy-D-arabino-heptulosonate 7-phosphate (DAHP) synthase class II